MTSTTANSPDRRATMPVLFTLGAIAAIAWFYVVRGPGMGGNLAAMDMESGAMLGMRPAWTAGYSALVFGTWVAMMAAMMLPSAVPAAIHIAWDGARTLAVLLFAGGYLAVWIGFSAVATVLQWALDSASLLSGTFAIQETALSGLVLIAAGLYQASPWKHASLRRCAAGARTQLIRPELWSAVRGGVRYGASCFGCCVALMVLLFVVGTMNVWWMAVIAAWVFAEKTFALGDRIAAAGRVTLIVWGAVTVGSALH